MAKSAHPKRSSSFEKAAERTAEEERAIQRKIDRSDKKNSGDSDKTGAMQAGARLYPAPPLPDQHLLKPGSESDLQLKPMYDAPHYKGSEKAARQDRADYRRRFGHRTFRGSALCSRGC